MTLGQGNPLLALCGLPFVEFAVPSVSIDFPCYMVSLTLGQGNPLLAPYSGVCSSVCLNSLP